MVSRPVRLLLRQIEKTSGRSAQRSGKCANLARMNKLGYVLLLASVPAWAQWTLVGSNEASATYADLGTIRKDNGKVAMSTMADFRNVQRAPYGPEYLSLKARQEYDCEGKRSRVLSFERYAGQMGGEDVVATHEGPDEWMSVPPGSDAEGSWKIACQ